MSILKQISVVVELGINHGGSLGIAKDMARTAIECGAKFIKHQTHIPDEEMTKDCKIYDLISRCALSEEDEKELQLYVEERGATFFSTPFSFAAIERLERFNVPLYKIASGMPIEIVEAVAKTGKPVIMSTGMYNHDQYWDRLRLLGRSTSSVAVLHCVNLYPTPATLANLGVLNTAKFKPNIIKGYSDHSGDIYVPLAAAALGADIIEVHFAHPSVKGPDWEASIRSPELLEQLIRGVEVVKQAREGDRFYLEEEDETREFALYKRQLDGSLKR